MTAKTFRRGDVVAIIDPRNPKYGDVGIILRSDRNAWLIVSVKTGEEYVPPVAHLGRSIDPDAVFAVEGR